MFITYFSTQRLNTFYYINTYVKVVTIFTLKDTLITKLAFFFVFSENSGRKITEVS